MSSVAYLQVPMCSYSVRVLSNPDCHGLLRWLGCDVRMVYVVVCMAIVDYEVMRERERKRCRKKRRENKKKKQKNKKRRKKNKKGKGPVGAVNVLHPHVPRVVGCHV